MPHDRIRYFAYGSNMLLRRLRAADRAPSATFASLGRLFTHRLTFDKIGADASGKCDAEYTGLATDCVQGVVFELNSADEVNLDRVEGLGRGYRKERVSVVTVAGPVDCLTYLATAKNPQLLPYHWYHGIVVAGALEHGFPDDYLGRLRAVPSVPDPDPQRDALHRALLFSE